MVCELAYNPVPFVLSVSAYILTGVVLWGSRCCINRIEWKITSVGKKNASLFSGCCSPLCSSDLHCLYTKKKKKLCFSFLAQKWTYGAMNNQNKYTLLLLIVFHTCFSFLLAHRTLMCNKGTLDPLSHFSFILFPQLIVW